MKYSILLTGRNNVIIEEMFTHSWEELECLSASGRYEDLKNHLKYFTPDAIVYCVLEEQKKHMQQLQPLKEKMQEKDIPLIVVGTRGDCEAFVQYAPDFAQLILEKPLSVTEVTARIARFLENKKKSEEKRILEEKKQQEEQARLEEEKKDGRRHILVVDDDPLMLKLLKEQLHNDYDVATAVSGKVALKFLSKKTTDLILLDYEMPEENGPEVLEKLRKDETTKDIPVVFLTGIKEREKIQKALVLKPQGYLLKPIDYDKLMETINSLLG